MHVPSLAGAERLYMCVCGWVRGWRHIIEEGLYGSAGGSERRAPVLVCVGEGSLVEPFGVGVARKAE